jgi:hypothetical protein
MKYQSSATKSECQRHVSDFLRLVIMRRDAREQDRTIATRKKLRKTVPTKFTTISIALNQ